MQVAEASSKIHQQRAVADAQYVWLLSGRRHCRTEEPELQPGPDECASDLPTGFRGMFENTFNYSSPEYQFGMNL